MISFLDAPKSISNKGVIHDYLPLAKACILETCTIVAITRTKSHQISLHPKESDKHFTQQYGDSAELIITFPSGITEKKQVLTVQVITNIEDTSKSEESWARRFYMVILFYSLLAYQKYMHAATPCLTKQLKFLQNKVLPVVIATWQIHF